MVRFWSRLVMAWIFAFATMSSPLFAQPAAVPHDASTGPVASAHMAGMSEACARIMKTHPTKATSHMPGAIDHTGGCCADGCNCPLGHCPATPPMLAVSLAAGYREQRAVVMRTDEGLLTSYLADTLKRPPRT